MATAAAAMGGGRSRRGSAGEVRSTMSDTHTMRMDLGSELDQAEEYTQDLLHRLDEQPKVTYTASGRSQIVATTTTTTITSKMVAPPGRPPLRPGQSLPQPQAAAASAPPPQAASRPGPGPTPGMSLAQRILATPVSSGGGSVLSSSSTLSPRVGGDGRPLLRQNPQAATATAAAQRGGVEGVRPVSPPHPPGGYYGGGGGAGRDDSSSSGVGGRSPLDQFYRSSAPGPRGSPLTPSSRLMPSHLDATGTSGPATGLGRSGSGSGRGGEGGGSLAASGHMDLDSVLADAVHNATRVMARTTDMPTYSSSTTQRPPLGGGGGAAAALERQRSLGNRGYT